MYYLLTGISVILTCSFLSCNEQVEYRLVAEFQFINETESTIEFEIFHESTTEIQLAAQESTEIFRVEASGGSKTPNIETCCEGILDDLLGSSGKFYRINSTECVLHENEKSDLINNYQSEQISERVFRYTYTFRTEDFLDAENCE